MAEYAPRILVIKPSSMGDIVHALQVVQTLKIHEPNFEISWVVRRKYVEFLESSPLVDRIFTLHRSEGIRGLWKIRKELRKEYFDYVFDMQGIARSGLITWFCKASRKVGRSDAREGASLFYNQIVPRPPGYGEKHALDILLQFCRVFGFETKLEGSLKFNTDEEPYSRWLERSGGEKIISIAPGSRSGKQNWPHFFELSKSLIETDPRIRILAMGLERVEPPAWFKEEDGKRVFDLQAKISAPLATRIVKEVDLTIATESGANHLSAALCTPTLALFGHRSAKRFAPYPPSDPKNRVIIAPDGNLRSLKVDAVQKTVMEMLANEG